MGCLPAEIGEGGAGVRKVRDGFDRKQQKTRRWCWGLVPSVECLGR